MLSVICPNCGKESPETTSFCTACGTRLNAAPQQPVAEPPAPPAADIPTPPAAPMPAPIPAPIPVPVPPTPLRRTPMWWSALRCIFSIPLTAVLTALLIILLFLFGIRNLTSANTLENMIKDVNIADAIAEEISDGKTDSLAEAIYDDYYETAIKNNADIILTEDELEEFFKESTIDDFIAEKGGEYLSALLTGENSAKVSKKELINLVKENEHIIEEITGGETLTDRDYEMIENFIEEEDLAGQLDMEKMGLDDDISEDLALVQSIQSIGLWATIIASLVVLLLLALFNLRGHFLTSLYSGIALLLSGGCAMLMLVAQPAILSAARADTDDAVIKIIEPVVETVCRSFWIPGLIALIVGIGCIALFVGMRMRSKKTPM